VRPPDERIFQKRAPKDFFASKTTSRTVSYCQAPAATL